MKNVVLIGFLLLSISANAQTLLGAKGGMNVSNFNGFTSIMAPRLGVHIGLFTQKRLKGNLLLQAEMLYSQKGGRHDIPIPISQTDVQWVRMKTNYTYMDLPVMVKYKLFKRFWPYTGPQISLLARKNAKLKGIETQHSTINGQGNIQIGLVAGLGYDISKRVGMDIRYSRELLGKGLHSHLLQVGFSYQVLALKSTGK